MKKINNFREFIFENLFSGSGDIEDQENRQALAEYEAKVKKAMSELSPMEKDIVKILTTDRANAISGNNYQMPIILLLLGEIAEVKKRPDMTYWKDYEGEGQWPKKTSLMDVKPLFLKCVKNWNYEAESEGEENKITKEEDLLTVLRQACLFFNQFKWINGDIINAMIMQNR